nr:immunoglobulin heavy chain junction region [Mus musculus]
CARGGYGYFDVW